MANRKVSDDEPVGKLWSKIGLVTDITALMHAQPPVKTTFYKVMEMVQAVVPFESGTLYLYNRKMKQLDEIVTLGQKVEPINFIQFEVGNGLAAWAAQHRKPVLLSNVRNRNKPPEEAQRSIIVLPMLIGDDLIGVINIAHSQAGFFKDKDLKLLTLAGDQIAVCVERMACQSELEKKNLALQNAKKELRAAQGSAIGGDRLQALRHLAFSINHEINNPLSVIVGNIQCLLYTDKTLQPALVDRLKKIEDESMRIAEINRRLLQVEELVSEKHGDNDSQTRTKILQESSAGAKT